MPDDVANRSSAGSPLDALSAAITGRGEGVAELPADRVGEELGEVTAGTKLRRHSGSHVFL